MNHPDLKTRLARSLTRACIDEKDWPFMSVAATDEKTEIKLRKEVGGGGISIILTIAPFEDSPMN